MPTLVSTADQRRLLLPAQAIVGRSVACALVVEDPYVSSEHAKIVWTGAGWEIRDLGSVNGTFVDGRRLEPGRPEFLRAGARVGFGDVEGYVLEGTGPPGAAAYDPQTGALIVAGGELLGFPEPLAPEWTVFFDARDSAWFREDAAGVRSPVLHGDEVVAAGRPWRLILPVISEVTPLVDTGMTLATVTLRFEVTDGDRGVDLMLRFRGALTHLERREHHRLLLCLARLRRSDADMPFESRGWRSIEELSRRMGVGMSTVHVAIHRARRQFADAGVEGAANVVEAAQGARRLGTDRIEIVDRMA